ncbi:MAG: AAA family ATPase [Acidobacteriota bacterium]
MNPFIYGGVVEGKDFANREKEMKELETYLTQAQNVLLTAPRKYGKTSLIINTLNRLRRKGALCAYINLSKVTSLHCLLRIYLKEVALEAEKDKQKALVLFRSLLPKTYAQMEIDFDDLMDPGFKNMDRNGIRKAAKEVFDLPQKVAVSKNRPFVMAFNEFQEIEELDGERILRTFKSCVKKNNKISYFFSRTNTDNPSELKKLEKDFNIDRVLELQKIPRSQLASYLTDKFTKTGYRLEKGVLDKVLSEVNDYPYNAQFLCHELWVLKSQKKDILLKDVDTTLSEIIKRHSPFYVSTWDNLTARQRNVLRAIARLGGEQVFSQEFARAGGVGSLSTLQTSIQLLKKKQILTRSDNRYEFTDVFFRKWISTEIN